MSEAHKVVGMARRDAQEIVEGITEFLEGCEGLAIPPTVIAKKLKLNYNACKTYLKLIYFIQEQPKLIKIKKTKGVLYSMDKDLTSYPMREQKKILKEEFGVKLEESDKLYIGLLEKKATTEKKALKIWENQTVKEGLKFRQLAKTKDGRVYLTELGQTIAKGAKTLFV